MPGRLCLLIEPGPGLLADHSGSAPVIVEMRTTEGPVRLRFGEEFRVEAGDSNLVASLMTMFGPSCVAS